MCSIRGSQLTARRGTDGRTVCRNASHLKLASAVINTTDEPDVNEEAQEPQIGQDLEILEKGTIPSVTPYQTTVFRDVKRTTEIPPEPKAEPTLGAERVQPVNQAAVTRPNWERRKSS